MKRGTTTVFGTREDGLELLVADAGKIDQQGRCVVKGRIEGSSNEWSEDEMSPSKNHRLWWNYDHSWELPTLDANQLLAMISET